MGWDIGGDSPQNLSGRGSAAEPRAASFPVWSGVTPKQKWIINFLVLSWRRTFFTHAGGATFGRYRQISGDDATVPTAVCRLFHERISAMSLAVGTHACRQTDFGSGGDGHDLTPEKRFCMTREIDSPAAPAAGYPEKERGRGGMASSPFASFAGKSFRVVRVFRGQIPSGCSDDRRGSPESFSNIRRAGRPSDGGQGRPSPPCRSGRARGRVTPTPVR